MAKILKYLRSRPEHERRIIGASLWLAIAAIITAIWVASFRQTLTIEFPVSQIPSEQKKATIEPKSASPALASELPGPLKSLVGGLEDFRVKLEEVSRRIQNQLEKFQLPQSSDQNQTPDLPRPDKTLEYSGSKIEFIAWVSEGMRSLSNVFSSLIEVLRETVIGLTK